MVPVHTVAILGTTDIKVPDPDDYDITREEVARLVDEGAKLFPDLPRMRILRAYAGVRPLYKPPAEPAAGGNRSRSPGPTRSSTTPTRASTTSSRSSAASSRPTG